MGNVELICGIIGFGIGFISMGFVALYLYRNYEKK